ncbi:MAG: hypothetical protein A2W22_01870 [Candidatus Levybacteria bacterium RBG_16_35_11]|nr:MAG: hypothetical protein A2W22_01870 [Candidatus Levybacteria bacterium RBG_16_35_11]
MGQWLDIIIQKVKNWFEVETIDTGWEIVGRTWKDEIKVDLTVLIVFCIFYLIYYFFGMYGIISTLIILTIIIFRKKIIYRFKHWRNSA